MLCVNTVYDTCFCVVPPPSGYSVKLGANVLYVVWVPQLLWVPYYKIGDS